MFSAGPDPLALDALDFGRRKLASKVRILAGHVFEVAAVQRYPVKIHARSFDRKVTARTGVLSHADALFVSQGWVPGCGPGPALKENEHWASSGERLRGRPSGRSVGLRRPGS